MFRGDEDGGRGKRKSNWGGEREKRQKCRADNDWLNRFDSVRSCSFPPKVEGKGGGRRGGADINQICLKMSFTTTAG